MFSAVLRGPYPGPQSRFIRVCQGWLSRGSTPPAICRLALASGGGKGPYSGQHPGF
jgi:hypothetical protein